MKWFVDTEAKIAKLAQTNMALEEERTQWWLPKIVTETLNDDTAVAYYAENAVYYGSYKKGEKALLDAIRKVDAGAVKK
jgi:hypothetical protein